MIADGVWPASTGERSVGQGKVITGKTIEEARVDYDDPCWFFFTSGTTGHPKGAMLSHANLLANLESCCIALEALGEDRFAVVLPMFHSFMLTVGILLPLYVGGSIVLVKSVHPAKNVLHDIIRRNVRTPDHVFGDLAAQVYQRVAEAREDLLLSLQDVDLGVHHRGAFRERDELGVLVRDLGRRRHAEPRELLREVGPLLLVTSGLAPRLRGKELDLRELALQALDLPVERRREVGPGADGLGHPDRVSPPASGSSPGAWRRPLPGSGR